MKYHHSRTFTNTTLEKLRPRVEEALKTEGFGVLTEIDIQATMKNKLDKDYLPHVILGACNPVYADKILSIEPNVSTLLPCNVCIRELENGDYEVSAMNPMVAMQAVKNPSIETEAKDVDQKLQNIIKNISTK